MKEFILPEKWAVKITEENQNTLKDYVESFSDFENAYKLSCHGFVISDTYDGSYQLWCETLEYEKYTEITFDQFKQYVLKQKPEKMKKQDFTIEGSVALKKAFIEECGVNVLEGHSMFEGGSMIGSWREGNIPMGLQGWGRAEKIHFNLKTQYGEALEYVKEYFKPEAPEFKVGDAVIREWTDGDKDFFIITKIENGFWANEHFRNGKFSCTKERQESVADLNDDRYILRHATPEEIEEYNNSKLPEIEGYEGKVVDKMIVYGNDCAKLPTKWFKDTFGATRHIKSMVLSSGVEINEEQMNQIRRVVNAKTK